MTTAAPEESGAMANGNTEVLIALSRVEGQLSSFIAAMDRHGTDLRKVEGDLTAESEARRTETADLKTRVTTIEAQRKATPGGLAIIGGTASILSGLAVVVLLLDKLYG